MIELIRQDPFMWAAGATLAACLIFLLVSWLWEDD